MGIFIPNDLVGVLSGKLGDLVFVRTSDGRVHVRHRPVRKAAFSLGERHGQSRLSQANDYVQRIRQQPDEYAAYQAAARGNGKRACDLARADFCHPPVIHNVDLVKYTGRLGDVIEIEASDDFQIASLGLVISDLDGRLLEGGPATLPITGGTWSYVATAAVPPGQTVAIRVTALDRPGHAAIRTVHHPI